MEKERKAEVLIMESVNHHRSSDRLAHILQEAEADSSGMSATPQCKADEAVA